MGLTWPRPFLLRPLQGILASRLRCYTTTWVGSTVNPNEDGVSGFVLVLSFLDHFDCAQGDVTSEWRFGTITWSCGRQSSGMGGSDVTYFWFFSFGWGEKKKCFFPHLLSRLPIKKKNPTTPYQQLSHVICGPNLDFLIHTHWGRKCTDQAFVSRHLAWSALSPFRRTANLYRLLMTAGLQLV